LPIKKSLKASTLKDYKNVTKRRELTSSNYTGYTSTSAPISISLNITPVGGSTSNYTGSCIASSSGTAGTCTVTFTATPGATTIAGTLSESGNTIANFSNLSIIQPETTDSINFTANPVVNSVVLLLGSASVNGGTPINVPIIVNAMDANGNTIVGTSAYVDANGNPVTLHLNVQDNQNGGTGTVRLQGPTVITAPGQAAVYAHYDGKWLANSAISVTATNSSLTTLIGSTLTITPTIIEYPLTLTGSDLWGITLGPDGNFLAYENFGNGYVAKISENGTLLNEYQTPTLNSVPNEGVIGSDGNIWITEYTFGHVERLTPSGVQKEFQVAGSIAVNYITAGPDGNLWITDSNNNDIIRMSTTGTYSTFPVGGQPGGIAAGSDGNIWFTKSGNSVYKMSTQGIVLNNYNFGTDLSYILTGPDGNLWVDDNTTGNVFCISVNGSLLHTVSLGGTTSPFNMTIGPDNNIWVTESGTNQVARISTSGTLLSTVNVPSAKRPVGITMGADGNIWITESNANIVGKLVL
jgi:streptogramin lyase